MNDIDIFIILYLIFGFLISFLTSFLFLRKYRNNNSKIPDNRTIKYAYIFYFSVIHFAFIIFFILLVILDHALFTFKDISDLNESFVIPFSEFLSLFYNYFSLYALVNKLVLIPILSLYFTTGFYKKDIYCDIIIRYIGKIFKKFYLIAGAIVLPISISIIITFHEWILEATKIDSFWSFWTFVKFLLNYLNFLSYIQILFFIGFAIQNIIRVDSIKRSEKEYENFYLWKLGKVFIYYIKEIRGIKKLFEFTRDDKFEKNKSEHIKNEKFKEFEDYLESIKPNIERILSTKLLEFNLNDIKIALDQHEEEVRERRESKERRERIESGKEEKEEKEEKGEKEEKEKEEEKKLTTKEKVEKMDQDLKKKIEEYENKIIYPKKACGFCCCCKNKSKFNKFKDDICDNITLINEEVIKTFRKAYIIDILIDKLKNINYHKINFCRSLKCIKVFWFVFLIMIIILEFPFQMLMEEEISFSYNFIDFLIALSIYSFSVIFYFAIFIYSAINHNNIQGELIFGKNSEIINYLNFIYFVYSLSNAAIYHSLWVFNKNGFIKAKFYNTFFLPENIINIPINGEYYSIKSLNIICYSTLAFITLSIFISSKFTELDLFGFSLVFNENTEFFFSDEEFYIYFILGCSINLYYKKIKPKEIRVQNEELMPTNSLNTSLIDEIDDENASIINNE